MAIFYNITQVGYGTLGNNYLRRAKAANGKPINVLATKNFTPNNPRTTSQQTQRAKFATAVKFYKRATKNFFKFAYEDKRSNESDYNAFMRHNVGVALPMNKYQVNSEVYPALGDKWQLSQGSLSSMVVSYNSGTDFSLLWAGQGISSDNVNTVGQLSSALITAGVVQAGDIITVVSVVSPVDVSQLESLTSDAVDTTASAIGQTPQWSISQFIVNVDDSTDIDGINHIGPHFPFLGSADDNIAIGFSTAGGSVAPNGVDMIAVGLVITRKESSSKLLASTSYLTGNAVYEQMVAYVNSDRYNNYMLTSWSTSSEEAILEGSIADPDASTAAPVITSVNGANPPASLGTAQSTDVTLSLVGRNFESEAEMTENSFVCVNCSVKSFALTSATAATLVVTTGASAGAASVSYNGTVIASGTLGDGGGVVEG